MCGDLKMIFEGLDGENEFTLLKYFNKYDVILFIFQYKYDNYSSK